MTPKSMSSEVENIELKGKENNTDKLNLSGQPLGYVSLLITMPWIRFRYHCRLFFRQFIPPDMMIFQEDMV